MKVSVGLCLLLLVTTTHCGDDAAGFFVSGDIEGLAAQTTVTLRLTVYDEAVEDHVFSKNGYFEFDTALDQGVPYVVTVSVQPTSQNCVVTNGIGTTDSPINVTVNCQATTPTTYTVGGTVLGLESDTVTLTLSGSGHSPQTIDISSDGLFTFAAGLDDGATYLVEIGIQAISHTCEITHGSGTLNAADVIDVVVMCTPNPPPSYTIGGTVSGLASGTITLLLNTNAQTKEVTANGAFMFADSVTSGTNYTVTIASPQPAHHNCSVANGTGTLSANVTTIAITCKGTANFLFPTTNKVPSTFGGRSAADTLCTDTRALTYTTLPCAGVVAFLSYNANDQIYDMTTTLGVDPTLPILDVANNYTKIADDWADLNDASIDNPLTVDWWSGTLTGSFNQDGHLVSGDSSDPQSPFNMDCNDFTLVDEGAMALIGENHHHGDTGEEWAGISDGTCIGTHYVMCLCYQQ